MEISKKDNVAKDQKIDKLTGENVVLKDKLEVE